MKQFLDFIPLVLFVAVFKTKGIYPAVQVLMASTALLYGYLWVKERKLETNQKIVLIATLAFGSLTLGFHNDTFIKWKAPVIYWVTALIFLGTHFVGKKLAIQRMMDQVLEMPSPLWSRLNLAWVVFSISMGLANWYVAFHYERYWVDFKVFGSLGLTLTFVIGQMLILSKYIRKETQETP